MRPPPRTCPRSVPSIGPKEGCRWCVADTPPPSFFLLPPSPSPSPSLHSCPPVFVCPAPSVGLGSLETAWMAWMAHKVHLFIFFSSFSFFSLSPSFSLQRFRYHPHSGSPHSAFFTLFSFFFLTFLSFSFSFYSDSGTPVLGLPSHSSAPPTHPTSSLRRPRPCARGSNASNSAGCDSLGHTQLVRGWQCLWPRAGALYSSVALATQPQCALSPNSPSSQVMRRAEACMTARVPDWHPHLLKHDTAHSDPSPECHIRVRL